MSKGVKTPRNLLCEIGPLNGDREEKKHPFFRRNVDDAFRRRISKHRPLSTLFLNAGA